MATYVFLKRGSALAWVSLLLSACMTGNCRQLGESEDDGRGVATAPGAPAAGGAGSVPVHAPSGGVTTGRGQTGTAPAPGNEKETAVVYKYDGSLQCAMGKAIPLDAMAKELTSTGVEVLSSESKPDGLMHIQVCGQPTGMANAFTIPASQLSEALKQGFKKWSFD